MWVIVFMIGFVVPIIVIGCAASWRDHRIDREHGEAARNVVK
jgi:hypothetical protein